MSGIINNQMLNRIVRLRKYLFRFAIWVFIAGIVMGAIVILTSSLDDMDSVVNKILGTVVVVAIMLIVSVNSFYLLESKKSPVQLFAILALVTSIIWMVLWILAIWHWDFFYACSYGRTYHDLSDYVIFAPPQVCEYTILYKIVMISSYLSGLGFVASNVLNLFEGRRRDLIRPLKIVATILAVYVCGYWCYAAVIMNDDFNNDLFERFGALAGFASGLCLIVWLVAWVISRVERSHAKYAMVEPNPRKRPVSKPKGVDLSSGAPAPSEAASSDNSQTPDHHIKLGPSRIIGESMVQDAKSEAELRAEVETEIRREMIEKEIRAKIAAEQKAAESKPQAESKSDSKPTELTPSQDSNPDSDDASSDIADDSSDHS